MSFSRLQTRLSRMFDAADQIPPVPEPDNGGPRELPPDLAPPPPVDEAGYEPPVDADGNRPCGT